MEAFFLPVLLFPKAADKYLQKGRSSDSLHLLRPSRLFTDSGYAGNRRLLKKLTASGNVRDSHPVPFSSTHKCAETFARAKVEFQD
jgi:hypothetical protein